MPKWALGGILRHETLMAEALSTAYEVTRSEVGLYRHKKINSFSLLLFLQASFILCKSRYDILVVTDPQVSAIALAALLFSKASKNIIFSHGWSFHNAKYLRLKELYFQLISKRILNKFKVICVSCNDKKKYPKSILLNNCASLYNEKPINPLKKNQIIYFGRLTKSKNIDLMLYLAEAICKNLNTYELQDEKVNFIFCGPNPEGITLCNSPNISMIDSPSDVLLEDMIRQSRFFMSLSRYEGFGISVVEALSFGCIPILSDIDPFIEHSKNIRFGKIINIRSNKHEMIQQIQEFISSFNDLSSYERSKAHEHVASYSTSYSPSTWSSKLYDIFSQ
jgi:glycosyltransferase involved in cell wall biosynthesis